MSIYTSITKYSFHTKETLFDARATPILELPSDSEAFFRRGSSVPVWNFDGIHPNPNLN
jgi:hypothetical protein